MLQRGLAHVPREEPRLGRQCEHSAERAPHLLGVAAGEVGAADGAIEDQVASEEQLLLAQVEADVPGRVQSR